MYNYSNGAYTHDQVYNELIFSRGKRTVTFRYELLDRYDRILGEVDSITGGNVEFNSLASIKGTAKFEMIETDKNIDFLNDRIRPIFRLHMSGGDILEWPLGIYLLSSPRRRSAANKVTRSIEAYDKLTVLHEAGFTDRYLVKAGSNYIAEIRRIIQRAGETRVDITESALSLRVDAEFEIGTSYLDAINTLLKAVNYTGLYADPNGILTARPYLTPNERDTDFMFRADNSSIVEDGAEDELDVFSAPNVFVIVSSTPEGDPMRSMVVNDSMSSPLSTINRGREIMREVENVQEVADQTTLNDIAIRRRYESTEVYGKVSFETAKMPGHSYLNIIYFSHPHLGITERYTETSWGMSLSPGGNMKHHCRREVKL